MISAVSQTSGEWPPILCPPLCLSLPLRGSAEGSLAAWSRGFAGCPTAACALQRLGEFWKSQAGGVQEDTGPHAGPLRGSFVPGRASRPRAWWHPGSPALHSHSAPCPRPCYPSPWNALHQSHRSHGLAHSSFLNMVSSFRKPFPTLGLGQVPPPLPRLPGHTVGLGVRMPEFRCSPPVDMCCDFEQPLLQGSDMTKHCDCQEEATPSSST